MNANWADSLQVRSQNTVVDMVPEAIESSVASPEKSLKETQWETFTEKLGVWGDSDFSKNGFVDHINTTKDSTDYLWYTTR